MSDVGIVPAGGESPADPVTPVTGGRRTSAAGPSGPVRTRGPGDAVRLVLLLLGALVFLFPFYYMLIGSLQTKPDTGLGGLVPRPGNVTFANYTTINASLSLLRALVNSGIFTGGVILCTVVFGLLAGYALAQLEFRGRGVLFAVVLLVQVIPFQLLMIPLYVLVTRDYGLSDNYLGMILPFAINATAVFIFRQFFLALPQALFEAARIDGASEFAILLRIAVPLCKPALLTTVLLTFIGPWNEFLWPFLVTKDRNLQPLAVALANYISSTAATASSPFGAILAGACVLAAPAVGLFLVFQKRFVDTNIGSGVKG